MCLLVGPVEELFGRGLLMNALARRYTDVWGRGRWSVSQSTVLASLLFAVWHIEWLSGARAIAVGAVTALTLITAPSFLLCLVYEKTRSLATTAVLHDIIDGGKIVVWYAVGRAFAP